MPVLQAAYRTDPGRVRTNNEDVPLVDTERGVYGVIDGVGGQAAGEFAAAIAYDVILQRLGRPLGTPAERVREAIALANNEIFRRAGTSGELAGMTCVVTLAVVNDGRLTIGHVGDSRLYKLGPEGMQKLTHDHSPVGEREDAQEIAEIDAMRHPRRHEVFRDGGGTPELRKPSWRRWFPPPTMLAGATTSRSSTPKDRTSRAQHVGARRTEHPPLRHASRTMGSTRNRQSGASKGIRPRRSFAGSCTAGPHGSRLERSPVCWAPCCSS